MIRSIAPLFFVLLFIVPAYPQEGDYHRFESKVIDIYQNNIEFVHVINLSRRFGVVSDRSGLFKMPVKLGDSLMLTHVSHLVRFVVIELEHIESEGPYELIMLPQVFELREVVVRPLPRTKLEFRQEFVNLELPPPPDSINLRIPAMGTMVYSGPEQGFGIVMKGPFQTFYDLFSKHARQMRKLEAELSAWQVQEQLERRYNPEIITRITGIEDESMRRQFMEFCRFSQDFILYSNDYDFYSAILRCFESFRYRMGSKPLDE